MYFNNTSIKLSSKVNNKELYYLGTSLLSIINNKHLHFQVLENFLKTYALTYLSKTLVDLSQNEGHRLETMAA